MTIRSAKPKTTPYRRSLYGKIEIAKKQIGMADETYRDLLFARYGKRSRKALGNSQLVDLVEHFKTLGFTPVRKNPKRAGTRPMAAGREARKIRALWLSLYHLGIVQDPSERALNGFVKRQTGVDDMRFMDSAGAFKVIEALKAWAGRPAGEGGGGVDWSPYVGAGGVTYDRPRARVLEAQWGRLHALGLARIGDASALSNWVGRFIESPCRISHVNIEAGDSDRAIEALGLRIRKALAERESGHG